MKKYGSLWVKLCLKEIVYRIFQIMIHLEFIQLKLAFPNCWENCNLMFLTSDGPSLYIACATIVRVYIMNCLHSMCSYMLFLFLLSYSQSEQRHLPGSFTILDTISASSAENTKHSYEQVQTILVWEKCKTINATLLKDSSSYGFTIFDATFTLSV